MAAREYRALIVDDEPALRMLAIRELSRCGFACDAASDGLQAREFAIGKHVTPPGQAGLCKFFTPIGDRHCRAPFQATRCVTYYYSSLRNVCQLQFGSATVR